MFPTARLAPLALLLTGACSWFTGSSVEPVQITNGFDFPVTVHITPEGSSERTLEVPAHGRVGLTAGGSHTIRATTASGEELSNKKYSFDEWGERKKGCVLFVNILGSAYVVSEEVKYGDNGMTPTASSIKGREFAKLCATWGLDVQEPPEAISVEKDYTGGRNLEWMHYRGEGDWHETVRALLKQETADNSHLARAWRIAIAVYKHDKDNPRLSGLGPEFKQGCMNATDFTTEGPLAYSNRKKCLKNHGVLFGG